MNEDITREQRAELIADAPFNYIIMDEDFQPVCHKDGNPVIFGSLDDIYDDWFEEGRDTAILSVKQYCRLFNRRVEDVMEYNN